MATAFNLTAQLNVQGPFGVKPVVDRLRNQLGSIKSDVKINFDKNVQTRVEATTRSLTEMENRLKSINALSASTRTNLSSLGQSFTNLSNSSQRAARTQQNTNAVIAATAKGAAEAASGVEDFGRVSGLAIRRFAGFSVATGVIFGFVNAVRDATKEAISFERELIKVQQVTGASSRQIADLTRNITELSKEFGVSSSSLVLASRTLSQAGFTARQTTQALEALAKTDLAPTFDNITTTTEGSIAALRQFNLETTQLESVLSSINAVAGRFAVESGDIIAAIRRTGGVFAAAAGDDQPAAQSLREFISLFTSVRATTRESAETIATGLRTIFTRIQRRTTIDSLKELGIELETLDGKFVGPFEAIQRLSEGLESLDPQDLRFAEIVEELGGFRQIGKVIPLIQQFQTAQEALKVATEGQDSLSKDARVAQQALAVQFGQTREAFLALIRDLTQTDTFRNIAEGVLGLTNTFIDLAGAIKPVLPLIAALGALRTAQTAVQFTRGFRRGVGAGGGAEGLGTRLAAGNQAQLANSTATNTNAVNTNTAAQRAQTATEQATSAVQQTLVTLGRSSEAALRANTVALGTNSSALNANAAASRAYSTILQASVSATSVNTSAINRLSAIIAASRFTSGSTAARASAASRPSARRRNASGGSIRFQTGGQVGVNVGVSSFGGGGSAPRRRFGGGGSATRPRRFAKGGSVRRFARGSVSAIRQEGRERVGAGNVFSSSDTVRLSKKVGSRTVQRGFVRKADSLLDDAGTFGAVFLRPGDISQDTIGRVEGSEFGDVIGTSKLRAAFPAQNLNRSVGNADVRNAIKAYDQQKKGLQAKLKEGVDFNLLVRGLESEDSNRIEDRILSGVIDSVEGAAQILRPELDLQSAPRVDAGFLKKINVDQITGNIFEGLLLKAGNPFSEKEFSNQTFDFPAGIGPELGAKFDNKLSDKATDAKNSFTSDSLRELIKKIRNQTVDNLGPQVKKLDRELEESFQPFFRSLQQGQKKGALSAKEIQDSFGVSKGVAGNLRNAEFIARPNLQTRAGGGEIIDLDPGGEGLVPALTMPGELIFGPRSTRQAGENALRKFNETGDPSSLGNFDLTDVSRVPGRGNSDSFRTDIPEGSFVIRKAFAESLLGNFRDTQKAASGGKISKFAAGGAVSAFGRGGSARQAFQAGGAVEAQRRSTRQLIGVDQKLERAVERNTQAQKAETQEAKKTNERFRDLRRQAAGGAGLAGFAAITIGPQIQSAIGAETSTRAGVGGAIGGALQFGGTAGFLGGAVGGPAGAAVGAVLGGGIGALSGFISGVNNKTQELEAIKIDESFKLAQEAVSDFNRGLIDGAALLNQFAGGAAAAAIRADVSRENLGSTVGSFTASRVSPFFDLAGVNQADLDIAPSLLRESFFGTIGDAFSDLGNELIAAVTGREFGPEDSAVVARIRETERARLEDIGGRLQPQAELLERVLTQRIAAGEAPEAVFQVDDPAKLREILVTLGSLNVEGAIEAANEFELTGEEISRAFATASGSIREQITQTGLIQRRAAEEAQRLQRSVDLLGFAFVKIRESIELTSASADVFRNQFDLVASGFQTVRAGRAAPDITAQNVGLLDEDTIQRALGVFRQETGDETVTARLESILKDARFAAEGGVEILSRVAATSGIDQPTIENQVRALLESAEFGGAFSSDEAQKAFIDAVREFTKSDQRQGQVDVGVALREDPERFFEVFIENLGNTGGALETLNAVIANNAQVTNELLQRTSSYVQTLQSAESIQDRINVLRAETETRALQLRGDAPSGAAAAAAARANVTRRTGGITDPGEIADEIRRRRSAIERIQQEAAGAGGAERERLIGELADNQNALNNLNTALKQLSADVTQLSAIEKELANLEKQRAAGAGLVERLRLAQADPESNQALLRDILGALNVLGKAPFLDAEAFTGGRSLLRQIGEATGQRDVGDRIIQADINALLAQGFPKEILDALNLDPQNEERDRLIGDLLRASENRLAALEAQQGLAVDASIAQAFGLNEIANALNGLPEAIARAIGGQAPAGLRFGGFIPGAIQGSNRDSKLINAQPGEFVVRREAVRNNRELLEQINGGNFRNGGIVDAQAALERRRQLRRAGLSTSDILRAERGDASAATAPIRGVGGILSGIAGGVAAEGRRRQRRGVANAASTFSGLGGIGSGIIGGILNQARGNITERQRARISTREEIQRIAAERIAAEDAADEARRIRTPLNPVFERRRQRREEARRRRDIRNPRRRVNRGARSPILPGPDFQPSPFERTGATRGTPTSRVGGDPFQDLSNFFELTGRDILGGTGFIRGLGEFNQRRIEESRQNRERQRREQFRARSARQRRLRGFRSGGMNEDSMVIAVQPGEFVINRQATRNNRALLENINNNSLQRFQDGGLVQGPGITAASGAARGGSSSLIGQQAITALNTFSASTEDLTAALNNVNNIAQFANTLNQAAQTLQNLGNIVIPERIQIESAPVQVNVVINGAEALANMQEGIQGMVAEKVTQAVNQAVNPITGETTERFI